MSEQAKFTPESVKTESATVVRVPEAVAVDQVQAEREVAVAEAERDLVESIDNDEIAHIATRYLRDSERTDLQSLLVNPETRTKAIGELQKISEGAYKSLISSLIQGSRETNRIGGDQSTVDSLGEEMASRGCKLFDGGGFKTPDDPDYWKEESEFIDARKGSGDTRWEAADPKSPTDKEKARLILEQAKQMEPELGDFLQQVLDNAGISDEQFVNTSFRTKSADSLLNKIDKFKQTEWGKDATIADAVDLLGGRIVVEDLASLEKIMLTVEGLVESNPGMTILRKENKFIANQGKPDPYRAIHYIVTMPGENGNHQTFELQLKTFSSMIASDLFHNAVYKPDVLKLPSELQDTVRDYDWTSDEEEMKAYLGVSEIAEPEEMSSDQKVEKAIAELDYNSFYDLVMEGIEPGQPLNDKQKEQLKKFHDMESSKLGELKENAEGLVLELAGAAHDSYFEKAARDMVQNPDSDQLGFKLSDEAEKMLPLEAQVTYLTRYEKFDGSNNKISLEQLGLQKLSDEELTNFFRACGKNVEGSGTKLSKLIETIKGAREDTPEATQTLNNTNVMNLYHASFKELIALADKSNPDAIEDTGARELWKQTLIQSQLKAIATSSILTEVGGEDADGRFRDLGASAFEGSEHSLREMYTFLFFISADRSKSEFADMSYEQFTTSPDAEWARDFDKAMDRAIMSKLITTQLASINEMIKEEDNNIYLARLQKAKYELAKKFISVSSSDRGVADSMMKQIDTRSKEEISKLIAGGEGAQSLIGSVKNSNEFNLFVNEIVGQLPGRA